MTKQVIIKIEEGSFELGFPVSLEFGEDGRTIARERNCPQLPPNPDFPIIYDKWKNIYTQLGLRERVMRIKEGQITNFSLKECENVTKNLQYNVKNWFKQPEFGAITAKIIGTLKDGTPNQSVRVIIDTLNPYLRKLSWDSWDLFEKKVFLPEAEFALLSQYHRPTKTWQKPISILAIFGSDEGELELEQDRKLIENLKRHGAKITSIPEKGNSLTPQELFDKIWLGNWDIIFYAGHSSGQTIHVDHALNLSVDLLKEALRRAAPKVKLAIFNSCDGLGIAEYLADFDIPNMIVMREPVPDLVAQRFLQYFLQEFTQKQPLHMSVREARRRLQQLEFPMPKLFHPRASKLPVLIQNPTTPELYWPNGGIPLIRQIILFLLIIIGFFPVFSFFVIPLLPKTKQIGDNISEGEEILIQRSQETYKKNGVEEFQNKSYSLAAQDFQKSWNKERRKDPETLIYLNNAILEATGVEYDTIAVVVPVLQDETKGNEKNTELAQEILRGVAQAQTEVNLSLLDEQKLSNFILPGADFLERNNLNGKGLKVIMANDTNRKKQAKKVANKIVKRSEILGVIGHWTSEMTMATVDIYDRNQLVLVSPGSTTSELTKQPRPFFFRVITTNDLRTQAIVDVLRNQIEPEKVTIFFNPDSPYSEDYKKHFEAKLKEKGEYVVESVDFSQNNFNAKDAIQKVRKSAKSAIVLVSDGRVTGSFSFDNALEIIKENGGQNWIVADSSIYSPQILNLGQLQLLEKLIISPNWNHLSSRQPKPNFPKTTEKLWGGSVSERTALSYDAAQVLIKAIRQKPTKATSSEIGEILAYQDFSVEGVTGEVKFKPGSGDRKELPLELVKVVPCPSHVFGFTFIPMKFATPEDAGLKCSSSD